MIPCSLLQGDSSGVASENGTGVNNVIYYAVIEDRNQKGIRCRQANSKFTKLPTLHLKKKDLTHNQAEGILQDDKEYTLGGDQIV